MNVPFTITAASAGSNTVKEITLANENGSALTDGTYYFVVLPNPGGAITMTFEATDGCTARVSATLGSAFSAGVIKNLGTVQGLTWEAPKYYTKVTSSDDLEDGRYLIVNQEKSVAFNGGLDVLDAENNYINVIITDDAIVSNAETDAASFDIHIDGQNSTIKSASGFYIGQTSSDANGILSSKETQYHNSITITTDDNKMADIVSSGGAYLRYNSTSNQLRFRYYKSTSYGNQKVIALYKYNASYVALLDPDLSFPQSSYEAIIGGAFTAPTLSWASGLTPAEGSITYAIDTEATGYNPNVASVNSSTGEVTIGTETGTAVIVATYAGNDDYKSGTAIYTITVTDGRLTLTFPFTSSISGWPAAKADAAAGSYTYPLSGTNYTFTHTKVNDGIYCSTSYLMITSDNYLGLPAIEGYRLYSVSATLNAGGNPSTAAVGTITSNTSGTIVSGGDAQTFDTKGEAKTFTLSGTIENTVYYLAISNKNFQCIGIELKYEPVAPDTREDADMSWSASTATATITTGENGAVINFTAPTLDEGDASDISYESTNTAVATISSTGVVTIVGPGETSIKAIFEGNENYKPQTVSYDLTVTDNRETVATPTFNPVQGTVEAGTAVSISCTTSGATIHFTVDGTEPTAESATYTSAITVNSTMEIKAIAVKTGYKDSAVATASYTVNGGGGTYSLTPDQASTGSNATSYITTLTGFTYNGVSWKMNQWNPKNLQIKTNQSSAANEFRFYNTSAFSGRISKVVITFSALTVVDASKLMFLGGTSEVTATTGGTAGTWNSTDKTLTWTPASTDNFTYFAFYQNGKAASGNNFLADTDAIVVTYE